MDSDSKVNVMTSVYVTVLGIQVCFIIIKALKINSFFFKIYGIIIASFKILDKFDRAQYFYKTFFFFDISIKTFF